MIRILNENNEIDNKYDKLIEKVEKKMNKAINSIYNTLSHSTNTMIYSTLQDLIGSEYISNTGKLINLDDEKDIEDIDTLKSIINNISDNDIEESISDMINQYLKDII